MWTKYSYEEKASRFSEVLCSSGGKIHHKYSITKDCDVIIAKADTFFRKNVPPPSPHAVLSDVKKSVRGALSVSSRDSDTL